jgi:hypothetical protein
MRRALTGLLKEYDNAFKYTKRRGKSQGTRIDSSVRAYG